MQFDSENSQWSCYEEIDYTATINCNFFCKFLSNMWTFCWVIFYVQHSVAHIRASDDKNTLKCCWTAGTVLHILEFLWFSMNAPLWAMLEEGLQAPKGSGDLHGFCSQSESKEGGGNGKQRKKGTFCQWIHWMLPAPTDTVILLERVWNAT